jgi:hypothetical protein
MGAGTGRPQRYAFGWVVAAGGLSNLANPALVEGWSAATGGAAPPLASVVAAWSVVMGLAAAAVRPWSWYVLLVGHALGLASTALYVTTIAPAWSDAAVALAVAPVYTVLSFAYFYKRRALFGAGRRWPLLERCCPAVVGPERRAPDARPGFTGLSVRYRILFVVVTILLILIGRA